MAFIVEIVPERPLQMGTATIISTPCALRLSNRSVIRPGLGCEVVMTFFCSSREIMEL